MYETRLETGDLIRQYSEFQFHKFGKLPQDVEAERRKKDATAYVKEVVNRCAFARICVVVCVCECVFVCDVCV